MKNYNFRAIFHNFNEKFCDFYKISRIFRENLLTNQNYAVVGGSGGGAHRTPEKIPKISMQKPMKITILGQFFKISMKILRFLQNF